MACKIEIKSNIEDLVRTKTNSLMGGSLINALNGAIDVNVEFNSEVVDFSMDNGQLIRSITVSDELVDVYYQNELKIDREHYMAIQDDNIGIKPGVEGLFESNPELANAVYEALIVNNYNGISIEFGRSAERDFGKVQNIIISYNGIPITSQDRVAGLGEMNVVIKDGEVIVGMIRIPKEYQGKGLAKYIYQAVADKIGLPIVDSKTKGYSQSESGGYIWKNRTSFQPNQITPQQKQQAQQQYSAYLDSIFPDSKVKDIVYHSRFNVGNIKNKDRWKNGFYSGTKDQADLMADMAENINDLMTTSALLINMQNPKVTTYTDRKVEDYKNTNDSFIIQATEKDALQLIGNRDGYNTENFKKEYVVFEPEQIHILGSKQDIEGFKDFVENNSLDTSPALTEDQAQMFDRDLSFQKTGEYSDNVSPFERMTYEDQQSFEKTVRDLSARISDRIGIKYVIENNKSKKYKGKIEGNVAYVNLAYATLDTPVHEILGHPIIRTIKNGKPGDYLFETDGGSELYKKLLKELEYGKGKEVLDRVKKDYNLKPLALIHTTLSKELTEELEDYIDTKDIKEDEAFTYKGKSYYNGSVTGILEQTQGKYTLEEQQEEAIVELLGLMTAEKLDAVKDRKLISVLKRFLKEIKAFVRNLINQKEVEIDKLPDNMTLGDLSDLLAYSNSKLILPGYEVEYTTPDNMKFKTYQEASNHISQLAKSVKDVDLDNVSLLKEKSKYEIGDYFGQYEKGFVEEKGLNKIETQEEADYLNSKEYRNEEPTLIKNFIEKNKEFEQSKEIIEEWKEKNNIKYNPEEIYSRGQEFISVVGAYSNFDVNLMMQNLLQHIEDNEKAGGKFAISAFTKPVDRQIGHLEGGGGKIKFNIYPKSEDILWASNIDVFSGSVWDASEKVNKDKKSELLGVSYTKYPSLDNVNTVQPNLANIVDNLAHHHNELGISLTGNNFRLEYDEDIPYTTKKIIDGINNILDQRYGKLVKPEIGNKYKLDKEKASNLRNKIETLNIDLAFESNKEKEKERKDLEEEYDKLIRPTIGIQPIQTNETLKESIKDVKNKIVRIKDKYVINQHEEQFVIYDLEEQDAVDVFDNKESALQEINKLNNQIGLKEKEYTEQALINTKIAALKEVAKKYPRSLIRSEVKIAHSAPVNAKSSKFEDDELPFQKIQSELENTEPTIIQPSFNISTINELDTEDILAKSKELMEKCNQ